LSDESVRTCDQNAHMGLLRNPEEKIKPLERKICIPRGKIRFFPLPSV
jgi:hypothetical protein